MTALLDPEVKHVTGWVVTGVGQHAYTIVRFFSLCSVVQSCIAVAA